VWNDAGFAMSVPSDNFPYIEDLGISDTSLSPINAPYGTVRGNFSVGGNETVTGNLTVGGEINGNGNAPVPFNSILLSAGAVNAPSLAFSSTYGDNAGLYQPAANEIAISTQGVQRFYIDQFGNAVFIGSVSTGNNSSLGQSSFFDGTYFYGVYGSNQINFYLPQYAGEFTTSSLAGDGLITVTGGGRLVLQVGSAGAGIIITTANDVQVPTGTFTVSNNAFVGGTLGVTGTTTLATANVTTLGVTGTTTLATTNATNLAVSGTFSAPGVVFTGSSPTFANLTVTAAETVGTNLSVAGSILQGGSTDTSRAMSCLNAGMATGGSTNYITLGQSASTNNQAELAFKYVLSGSASNAVTLGLYGTVCLSMTQLLATFSTAITCSSSVTATAFTASATSNFAGVSVSGGLVVTSNQINITPSSPNNPVYQVTNGTDTLAMGVASTSGGLSSSASSGDAVIRNVGGGVLYLQTGSGSAAVKIDTSNNVTMIGSATVSANLIVTGTGTISSNLTVTGALLANGSASITASSNPYLTVGGNLTIAGVTSSGAFLTGTASGDSVIKQSNTGKMYIQNSNGSTTAGQGITLDSSNNLTVGGTLTISNNALNINASSTAGYYQLITAVNPSLPAGQSNLIVFGHDTSTGNNCGQLGFSYNSSGSGTNGVTIGNNGAVVLTVTPNGTSLNSTLTLTGTYAAYKSGGGSWTATSDERLKKNVENYSPGLSEVERLRPVKYEYNGTHPCAPDTGKTFVGLIAQEAQKVFPSMVESMEHNDDYLGLDSSELVYALVNAVKTLSARVQALESLSSPAVIGSKRKAVAP
jgi:hypothetical protein